MLDNVHRLPLAHPLYPPAPWRFRGQAWAGLFRTAAPVPLPAGLRPLLGRRSLVVALVRYLQGPLRYDELLVGPPVRCGGHIGVWVDRMWVNDRASLLGGRRIWGLPKELAHFDWADGAVHIADADGPVATLAVDRRLAWLPPLPAAVVGLGRLGGQWTIVPARGWAWPMRAGLELRRWSPRFAYQPAPRPLAAFAASPFRATIDKPQMVDAPPL